jgi:hypothetical protein
MRLTYALLASFLLMSPCHADSDDSRSVAVNDTFFDGIPVAPATEILMVNVDPTVLDHGDADAELIQYPKPDSERQPDSCGLDTSPLVPFTLDCGVKMLGVETGGDQSVYYFLLKAHQGDWYQIVLSPQSGATTWVHDVHENGLWFSLHRLVDWLQSQDSYRTAHEIIDPIRAVPVMAQPKSGSEDLTDCASYDDEEGLIPAEDKARDGDWVHVICLENGCYASQDPLRVCARQMNMQGVPCIRGWARWRSPNGHLTIYPHVANAQGCY